MVSCLLSLTRGAVEQLANEQCYVNEAEYDDDILHNPIFEGGGFIGNYTLAECLAHCDSSTDSKGRPCVAIEWSDGGEAQSSDTTKLCALAWGCDYTASWDGGSVYQIATTPTPTFEVSFTADSLSAESGTWSNEGTLGSDVDISSLTGTVQSESTNGGGSINALCFDSSQTAQSDITYIQYDTNSEVRPDLTMEVWWRPDEYADSTDWILGHDDGGYDRGITTYDTNFGGLSMGIGASYTSTVSYPDVGEWTHIVATWSSDGTATLYKNGGDSAGGSQQTKSISSDSGSRYEYIGLNGLGLYSGHTVIGCFAQVQLVNRAVTADEAADLYAAFGSAMNSSLVPQSDSIMK